MRAFYEWKVQLNGGALSLSRLAWILSLGTVFLASCGGPGTSLNAGVAAPNISVPSATTDSLTSPHLSWEVLDLTPSSSQPVLSPSGLFPGDFSTAVIGAHAFLVKLYAGTPQGVGNLTLGGSIREVQCGYFYTATSSGSLLRQAVPVGHPVSRLLEGDFQTETPGEMSALAYIVVDFNSQMPPANNDRQICPMAYTGPLVSPELHMGVTFNGTLRLWGMASTRAAARRSTVWLTIQVLPE
jgi:hypothetical protein